MIISNIIHPKRLTTLPLSHFIMGLGLGSFLLTLVRLYLRVYDLLTSWLYSLLQSPAKVRAGHAALRAVPCKPMVPGDTSVTYKPCPLVRTALVSDFEHAQLGTMAEVWTWVVERYSGRKVLGTRDVAGEEDEIQPNGTVFKKLKLGDYRFKYKVHGNNGIRF